MTTSKSDYMLFLRHPAWLWLKKFEKHKLPPIDDNLQALFDAGRLFESYAEKNYPHATKLGFDNYNEYLSLPQRTGEALENGAEAILQGRFETDGLTCIVDVLEKNDTNKVNLIEIKASTRAKPEHYYDLAFQTIVLQKSGFEVDSIAVVHANKEYVRNGSIDHSQIVGKTEVTDKVRELIPLTLKQIKKAKQVISSESMPDLSPGLVNQIGVSGVSKWMQEWLDIFLSLKPQTDDYNIYTLSYPSPEQIADLEDQGITSIKEMTEDQALRDKQKVQIRTTKTDTQIILTDKINEFVNSLKYPLYFFDYETFSSVVPQFDGCSPYKDYPFQYSLHVKESPDSEIKHFEYLHEDNSNPMPSLLAQLKTDIDNEGTVLTWNMRYEKGCNNRMAALYPEYADFLEKLNDRINDLMIPFSKMWFFDKDFFGSASVKKVMPVLCPELSYKELNVGDGLLARRLWTETILENKNQHKKDEILSDLSKYCTLDTYAMVRILEELEKTKKDNYYVIKSEKSS